MGEDARTKGSKTFHWSNKDSKRVRSEDTESSRNFKESLKEWRKKKINFFHDVKKSTRKVLPKNLMKFVPILGLIILFAIYSGRTTQTPESDISSGDLKDQIVAIWNELRYSFVFSDTLQLITTIILLITIWTGFKYWLVKLKFIRKNYKLTERILFVVSFIIFGNHIRIGSMLGNVWEWGIFLAFLYLILAGTGFILKWIDQLNMRSDLVIWLVRLAGGLILFFGIMFFLSLSFTLTLSKPALHNNLFWILGLCIIAIGAFCEYRSFRRHPAIHVW